jgi:hypothetical protein
MIMPASLNRSNCEFHCDLRRLATTPTAKSGLNPEYAVDIYCGLQTLAATLVSQFRSSTYQWICLRHEIAPTARFAAICGASLRRLLQNLGLKNWYD